MNLIYVIIINTYFIVFILEYTCLVVFICFNKFVCNMSQQYKQCIGDLIKKN